MKIEKGMRNLNGKGPLEVKKVLHEGKWVLALIGWVPPGPDDGEWWLNIDTTNPWGEQVVSEWAFPEKEFVVVHFLYRPEYFATREEAERWAKEQATKTKSEFRVAKLV